MRKFKVSASVYMATQCEPDGYLESSTTAEGMEDFEDVSSWDHQSVTLYGGGVEFTVEAEDDVAARDIANDVLTETSFSDDSFEIEGYDIEDVEEIVPPMNMERATEMLRAFLARMREMGGITADEEEAFSFLLDRLTP